MGRRHRAPFPDEPDRKERALDGVPSGRAPALPGRPADYYEAWGNQPLLDGRRRWRYPSAKGGNFAKARGILGGAGLGCRRLESGRHGGSAFTNAVPGTNASAGLVERGGAAVTATTPAPRPRRHAGQFLPSGPGPRPPRPYSPSRRDRAQAQNPIDVARHPAVQPSSFLGHPPAGSAPISRLAGVQET